MVPYSNESSLPSTSMTPAINSIPRSPPSASACSFCTACTSPLTDSRPGSEVEPVAICVRWCRLRRSLEDDEEAEDEEDVEPKGNTENSPSNSSALPNAFSRSSYPNLPNALSNTDAQYAPRTRTTDRRTRELVPSEGGPPNAEEGTAEVVEVNRAMT